MHVRHKLSQSLQQAILPVVLLLIFFFCIAFLQALTIPRGYGPDELAHIDYIYHLAWPGTLPIHGVTTSVWNDAALNPQAMQPPLYYLLATPIVTLLHGQSEEVQTLGLRMVSVVIGMCSVVLSYLLGRRLTPHRPQFAFALAALVASLPMFTYVSAYVTNDGLATLICIGIVLCWTYVLERQDRLSLETVWKAL